MEQKIKQDSIRIGENIRRIRLAQHIKQTQLVQLLQLEGINMTRETLVKIERGVRHIEATQLRGIRDALHTTYDDYSGNHNQLEKIAAGTSFLPLFFYLAYLLPPPKPFPLKPPPRLPPPERSLPPKPCR